MKRRFTDEERKYRAAIAASEYYFLHRQKILAHNKAYRARKLREKRTPPPALRALIDAQKSRP